MFESMKLEPPTSLQRHPIGASPILLRPRYSQTHIKQYRNINLLSIDYAVRPRLRIRLTLNG